MLAPIVIFTYNRVSHTKTLINSLLVNQEAADSDLYIFSDGSRDTKDEDTVQQVREYLHSISGFHSITITENPHNIGLATSVINGVSTILENHNMAIVLEDDLIVSNDFLKYMNHALNYYQNSEKIWAISGFTLCASKSQHSVYFAGRACSWGWATWKDRWEKVDWGVSDYPLFRHNIVQRKDFGKWGIDMPDMLDRCMLGDIHSWAIRWCYSAWKNNMLTVYPNVTYVRNDGTDGSGTNFTKKTHKYDTQLSDCEKQTEFVLPYTDDKIRKKFKYKNINLMLWIKIQFRVIINQFRSTK